MRTHIPVLLNEVLDFLLVRKDGIYYDLTTGEGGHSLKIAEYLNKNGQLVCFDRDHEIQKLAKNNLSNFSNIQFTLNNFTQLKDVTNEFQFKNVTGILADLGLSMFHYKVSEKGFSFLKDDELNMSLDHSHPNAYDVVNSFSQTEIADIIFQFGEERLSRRIASFIVAYRKNKKIETTKELAEIIFKSYPGAKRKRNFHPATKTFQALRIYVNKELDNLKSMINDSIEILEPGGRLIIISYHSLEDRIVKWAFREKAGENQIKILTKRPIISSDEEIKENSSARSAKMRVVEKI